MDSVQTMDGTRISEHAIIHCVQQKRYGKTEEEMEREINEAGAD
jgi:hypothetical protein